MFKGRASGKIVVFTVLLIALISQLCADNLISIKDAQEVIIKNNLSIKALDAKLKAAEGSFVQAGLRSNPELEIGLENLGIAKLEVGLSQTFELGGKRNARKRVAEKSIELLKIEYSQLRRELESEIIRRVVPIVGLKKQLLLIDEIIAMSKSGNEIIETRVSNGSAMEIDLLSSEIELNNLHMERENISRELKLSKNMLKAVMGENSISFDDIVAQFSEAHTLPLLPELEKYLENSAQISSIKLEGEVLNAELKAVKANAVADLTIGIGYERNNEENANSGLLGISFPLPIFNRNQGEISEKREAINGLNQEAKGVAFDLKNELLALYISFSDITQNIEAISMTALPKIEHVFEKINDLYSRSAVPIFDVIDIQVKLVETKISIIELKTEQAEIAADIYELTGYMIDVLE